MIVLHGSAAGLSTAGAQLLTQAGGAAEANDAFGTALTTSDFNRDGFADLAGSVSGEDVGTVPDAGAVSVLYGSPSGLTRTGGRLFTQVGGAVEAEDFFADTLAAGDFDMTGSPTWRRRPGARTSAACWTPARSACSMAPRLG